MSITTSKHRELTELIVEAGDETNRNHETISTAIILAGLLTTNPGTPVVQDMHVRIERPMPEFGDDVTGLRLQFEEIAHALRRNHFALSIETACGDYDFTWRLGPLRIDWTVPISLLGPEPFLCTTCHGSQRGPEGHCDDCDHGYFDLIEVRPC